MRSLLCRFCQPRFWSGLYAGLGLLVITSSLLLGQGTSKEQTKKPANPPQGAATKSAPDRPTKETAPPKKTAPEETTPAESSPEATTEEGANVNPNALLSEQSQLPKIQDMPLPTAARLLQGPDFDWIVLRTDRVLAVEPVQPRPNTLTFLDDEHVRLHKLPLPNKQEDPEGFADLVFKRRTARLLPVTLLEGETRDFFIHRKFMKEILYCEELMLRRTDKLLDENKTGEAYELLENVVTRRKDWPGLDARQDRLLFVEAQIRETQNNLEEALAFLEQLHHRNSKYEGLSARLGNIVDRLIQTAMQEPDFRRARFFLSRLMRLESGHPVVKQWTADFAKRGQALLAAALAADQKGDGALATRTVEQVARLWPQTANLAHEYTRLQQRHQLIRVGVTQLPDFSDAKLVADSPAVQRVRSLLQVRLFEPAELFEQTLRYRSRWFEEWEPTDLGRSLRIRLRSRRAGWESIPEISAPTIIAQLRDRLRPESSTYDERLAQAVERITFQSPWEFTLTFRQVPLRPDGFLAFPLQRSSQSLPVDRVMEKVGLRLTTGTVTVREVQYLRVRPEVVGSGERHVAEILERKYDTPEAGVRGVLRGDVDLFVNPRLSDVPLLLNHPDVVVKKLSVPVSWVIQFHPRSSVQSNRALRRTLLLSLNRQEILEKFLLNGAGTPYGRVTTAPFPTTHLGYHPRIIPQDGEYRLATSLMTAAKKEAGGEIPELKLACVPDAVQAPVLEEMTRQWAKVGLKVTLVPWTVATEESLQSSSPPWDLILRTERMIDPLVELWPYITLSRRARMEPLLDLPVWLRQKVLELDQSVDNETALERIRDLHQHLWAETNYLPLWELDEFLVHRKHLREIPATPMSCYQNVERWRALPVYRQEGL